MMLNFAAERMGDQRPSFSLHKQEIIEDNLMRTMLFFLGQQLGELAHNDTQMIYLLYFFASIYLGSSLYDKITDMLTAYLSYI